MSNLVSTEKQMLDRPSFTDDKVELIKRTVAKGATDDELKLFLHQCQKTGLDPLAKQIYFQKRTNRKTGEATITIITAIDGYRLVAHRTGLYAGIDPTVFDNEENPKKASVTVYKLVGGVRCPFTATARWDQYYPGDYGGMMWKKMPHLMLEKCAESLALRKAFPAELSGVFTKEDMDQAEPEIPEVPVRTLAPVELPTSIPMLTKEQRLELKSVMDSLGWDLDRMKKWLVDGHHYASGHDVPQTDFQKLKAELQVLVEKAMEGNEEVTDDDIIL